MSKYYHRAQEPCPSCGSWMRFNTTKTCVTCSKSKATKKTSINLSGLIKSLYESGNTVEEIYINLRERSIQNKNNRPCNEEYIYRVLTGFGFKIKKGVNPSPASYIKKEYPHITTVMGEYRKLYIDDMRPVANSWL